MACGRLILASLEGEEPASLRKLTPEWWWLPEDASALAEAVLTLSLMSSSEREVMGQNGRRYFLQEFERKQSAHSSGWLRRS